MGRLVKVLFSILLFSVQFMIAQATTDVATMNIDYWSDEKIESFWESAKKRGYTISQLEVALRSKGIPQYQIEKLKVRINKINNTPEVKKVEEVNDEKNTENIFGIQENDKVEIKKDSLYGYDFFNNPKISFTPNINVAAPQNYQLGPGDVVKIDVWGAAEASYKKEIDSQGNIHIERLGAVNLNGLTFKQATTKIESSLKRIYSGISVSGNSYNRVYVGVSLAEVRNVQVNLVGEVKIPGTYSLSGLSTVLNALYAAGGPTKDGDFRNITLVRYGKKIAEFDFYQYLQRGSEKGNLSLQDQDVIIVSPYQELIKVVGAVKRTGYYQMKEGETMQNLFRYCGGFTADAYRKGIAVERVKGMGKEIVEFDFNKSSNELVKNGDVISVKYISDKFENGVTILGAVYVPGMYQFKEGMSIRDLIQKASGLKDEAFLKRGLITRYKNEVDREAVSFSLEGANDVELKSNDEVRIYSKNDLREERKITINGAVNNPNSVDFVEGMTIEDLIAISGGLKQGADATNIEVSRRMTDGSFEKLGEVFKLSSSNDLISSSGNEFELKPYDVVSVRYLKGYTSQKKVSIKGEVKAPGDYAITSKNERISDLLERAGGLSPYAYVEGATLIRKKIGEIEKKQLDFLNEIQEKDTLLVGEKVTEKKEFRIGINLKEILENKKGLQDLVLQEEDELLVPIIKQTIEVRGEVYSPSLVQYVPGKSLKYYIDGAGGFTTEAKKNRAYVVYSNGSIDATNNFLFFKDYPKVKPGATILVPKRKEGRKVSAQEIIGITTGLATLGVLIDRLTSSK